MKNIVPLLLTFLSVTYYSYASTYYYECEGIIYSCNTSINQATVIANPNGNKYSGEIAIVPSFEYSGRTFQVTGIKEKAFYKCSELTSVVIPWGVEYIGENAFRECTALKTVTFSIHNELGLGSLKRIEKYSFADCTNLEGISFPLSLETIGEGAFWGCQSIQSLYIPKDVTSIGRGAFATMGNLSLITVEETNTNYDSRENCNAIIETSSNKIIAGCKNTIIPNSVVGIGDYAFRGCKSMTSIHIPSKVKEIGYLAFYICQGLESISVAADNACFDSRDNCNAIIETNSNTLITACKNTIIPQDIVEIGVSAFNNCYNCEYFTSLIIPANVEIINANAFSSLNYLKDVYCYSEKVPSAWQAFDNTLIRNVKLYVPQKVLNAYKVASDWREFGEILAIPDDMTSVKITDSNIDKVTSTYSIMGMKTGKLSKGLNIRKENGAIRKILRLQQNAK